MCEIALEWLYFKRGARLERAPLNTRSFVCLPRPIPLVSRGNSKVACLDAERVRRYRSRGIEGQLPMGCLIDLTQLCLGSRHLVRMTLATAGGQVGRSLSFQKLTGSTVVFRTRLPNTSCASLDICDLVDDVLSE